MTIDKIIKGCKSQKLSAQRLLYEKYSKKLYPICVRYCKDQQSAGAALHAGFLKVFQNIAKLEDTAKLEAWMSRIIVNASIDQLKADKKFSFEEIKEYNNLKVSESVDEELPAKYLPLLNMLPAGYKMVFSMRVLEDMSHKEIAKALDISENTSRSQLLKARKMLAKILENKQVII